MKTIKKIFVIFVIVCLVFASVTFGGNFVMKKLYPVKYSDIVEKYSEEYGVEKSLVYAVIKSESNFKPNAVSSVGALGLMQLLPETFEWLTDKTGDVLSKENLFEEQTSIKYGVFLLKLLLDEFDGETFTAVAAYHAGIGIVGQWLENPEYSKDGKTFDYIPYDDTRLYIENVKTAKKIYEKLYDM